ncbi:V-type proton ATPase subunit e [Bulinus truncatus]|nr:V-type proton ATPase subunit e [Bulinus truncatus]
MARSPNKGIVQICLILTGICCFIFWIVTFIAQLNPLIGPQLHTGLIRWILIEWYGEIFNICFGSFFQFQAHFLKKNILVHNYFEKKIQFSKYVKKKYSY